MKKKIFIIAVGVALIGAIQFHKQCQSKRLLHDKDSSIQFERESTDGNQVLVRPLTSLDEANRIAKRLVTNGKERVVFVRKRALHLLSSIENDIETHNKFIDGIKHFEGFRNHVYTCPGGIRTIGYGFTGKEIKGRSYITEQQARKELVNEIIPRYAQFVNKTVKVPLTKHQKLVLTSFAYNCGPELLRILVDGPGRLNSGNYESVERLLPLYCKAKGKISAGLQRRRSWELAIWKNEVIPTL